MSREEKTCKKLTNQLTIKRSCRNITAEINKFIEVFEKEKPKVEIYVDLKNEAEISELFMENRKKLFSVLTVVMNNRYDDMHYKMEYKEWSLTAMKFGKRRVICKEFFFSDKKVVVVSVEKKQSSKNDKRLTQKYKTIGGYEYEFK